jgi:hypothetical protein
MAGEKGTHIRDNLPTDTALSETQNRHHLAVSLHDNTIYRLRIQLDCSPSVSSMPLGIYDFEIHIPGIDEQITRSGSHRMRIVVTPSEEYRKKCGNIDSSETREYTVNVIPKAAYRGNMLTEEKLERMLK